jgi:hypothetical protein
VDILKHPQLNWVPVTSSVYIAKKSFLKKKSSPELLLAEQFILASCRYQKMLFLILLIYFWELKSK